jgi:uncharacterized membrane protein
MTLDLAAIVFDGWHGAEVAYAEARERAGDQPWVNEVAIVQHHHTHRVTVRGTFAGRYVDVGDRGDVVGPDPVLGAVTGALIGAAFGPPGFAAGLVGGGMLGGFIESVETAPRQEGDLFEEIRRDVPPQSSAVMLLAEPSHVDAMIEAFDGLGGRVTRRSLSDEQADALLAAPRYAPPAAPAG